MDFSSLLAGGVGTTAIGSMLLAAPKNFNTATLISMGFQAINIVSKIIFLPFTNPGLSWPFYLAGAGSLGVYIGILAVQKFVLKRIPVNLKTKYNAEWALVTGASSGIGLAITEKLAMQDINVVMVALPDETLNQSFEIMKAKFPRVQFRKIGANLADPSFINSVIQQTNDIRINLLFNNAGFITTGFFHKTPLARLMANVNCNATAVVPLTHHFLNKVIERGSKGFVAFTSSSAGFVPNPLSSLYPATKSFLTLFASSLAAEVKSKGIDVVVVHPSPTNTNFFSNSGGLQALEAFKSLAASPAGIANVIFNSAGRFVVYDQGAVTILLRIISKIIDFNFFTELVCRTAHTTADFKKFDSSN